MGAYSAERAGQTVIEAHRETEDGREHEEVYLVVRGEARFTLDHDMLDAPAGTVVRVAPEVHRGAVALTAPTVVVALGDDPNFEPSASEWIERARPLIRSDPSAARRIIDDLREQLPDDPAGDVGEALLLVGRGEQEPAREILRHLIQGRPPLRATLLSDPDLADLIE